MKRYRVWHPESPGVSLIVWRPWWRRRSEWATTKEIETAWTNLVDLRGRESD